MQLRYRFRSDEDYVPLDYYNPMMQGYYGNSAIRGSIADQINDGSTSGKIWSFLYQTSTSMLDSGVVAALTMGTGLPVAALLGGSAATSSMMEAKARGATDDQAVAMGLLSGIFETLFEEVSIDKLLTLERPNGIRAFLKNTMKQAFTEGSEEVNTTIANTIADAVIMADRSEINTNAAAYEAEGLSAGEAKAKAWLDAVKGVGLDFLGGAISGGVMGGMRSAAMYGQYQHANASLGADVRVNQALDQVIQTGLEAGEGTEAYRQALQLQEKQAAGKKISDRKVGALQRENLQGIQYSIDELQRMQASSLPENVKEAISSLVNGNGISSNQANAIYKTEGAIPYLERIIGTKLNTDQSISGVKNDIRALASRAVAQTQNDYIRGTMGFQTEDRAVRAARVAYQNAQVRESGMMGEAGSRAFAAANDGAADESAFLSNFVQLYNAGASGKSMKAAKVTGDLVLNEAQRFAAYTAGQNDARAAMQNAIQGVKEGRVAVFRDVKGGVATMENDLAGLVRTEHSDRWDSKTVDHVDRVARALGLKVVVDAAVAAPKGNGAADGYIKDGVIHLSADVKNAAAAVVRHEITHRMQELSTKAYQRFRDYVMRMYTDKDVAAKRSQYQESGIALSQDAAMDELAADYAERLLTDENAVNRLIGQDRSLAEKLRDAIRSIAQTVKEKLGKADPTLEQAQRLWDKAFQAAEKQAAELQTQKNTAREGGTAQYLLNPDFGNQFDQWYQDRDADGTLKTGGYLHVGTTSEALRSIGVDDYAIYWDKSKLAAIMKKHPEMTTDVIKEVPQIMEHPILVMQSQTVVNRITLLGEITDATGMPVLVAMELRPQSKRGEIQDFAKVASAYGKRTVQNAIDTSDILYVDADIKRTNTWLEALRLQLPAGLTKYGSIANVTYVERDVNGKIAFGETGGKTDMQIAMERALQKQKGAAWEDGAARYRVTGKVDSDETGAYTGNVRSEAVESVIQRLNSGEKVPISEILALPEVVEAERYGTEAETYTLPDREGIRQSGYEQAMAKGSWNGTEYAGPVRQERRMDIVIGLPGSGKSSVYTERISQEQGARVIDTDDFREYIPEYNGRNAQQVHRESSMIRNMVRDAALKNGENIILSTIGADAQKLAADIDRYKALGYTVYLHLNELPNHKAMARALGRYVQSDGTLGRYVSPELIESYGNLPTQAYLQLTREGYNHGQELDASLSGSGRVGGEAGLGVAGSTGSRVQGEAGGGRLAGWDWYNNDVGYGEAPRLIESSEMDDTGNPDARYSLKQQSAEAQAARQQELIDYLRAELRRTKGAKTDPKAVRMTADSILNEYSSGYDAAALTQRMQDAFDWMANGTDARGNELAFEGLLERMTGIARDVLADSLELNDESYQTYKELRDDLRGTKIHVPRSLWADLESAGGYNEFRKANMGRLNLSSAEGVAIDTVFQELAEQYPEFFDADETANPADQLLRMADVLDGIRPVYENRYASDMDRAANFLAADMIERFYETPQKKPTAMDRADQRLMEQKLKGQKQLDKLRAEKNARIEEIRRQGRQDVQDAVARERQRRDELVQTVKEHYQTKEGAGRERRSAAELRRKITRHAAQLSQKLLRPSDRQHIPENLRGPVAAVLEAINQESQYTIDPSTGKRVKGGDGDPVKRTEAFRALKERYAEVVREGADLVIDPNLFGSDSEDIQGNFDKVLGMQDVRLADMNAEQLQVVWDVLRAVEHSVAQAGKLLAQNKYAGTKGWAEAFSLDNLSRRDKRTIGGRNVMIDMETPITFFDHYGDAGRAVYQMLRDAQDHRTRMIKSAADAVQQIIGKTDIRKLQKEYRTFQVAGGDLTLTTAQVMDLYELSKREQAGEHLRKGGVVQPEVKAAEIHAGTDAVRLELGDVAAITGTLTAEQKRIADGLQGLMAGMLADFGNEASMQAYGYRKFTGADYWPIRSSKAEVRSSVESGGENTRSIRNIGLAKIPGGGRAGLEAYASGLIERVFADAKKST